MNLEQLFEMPRGERLVTRLRRALADKLKKAFGQTDREALVNSTKFFPEGMSDQEAINAAKEAGIDLNGNSKPTVSSDEQSYYASGVEPAHTPLTKTGQDNNRIVKFLRGYEGREEYEQISTTIQMLVNNYRQWESVARNPTAQNLAKELRDELGKDFGRLLKYKVTPTSLTELGIFSKDILNRYSQKFKGKTAQTTGAIDTKDVDELDQELQTRFREIEDTLTHVRGPKKRGEEIFQNKQVRSTILSGKRSPKRLVADMVYAYLRNDIRELYDHLESTTSTAEIFSAVDSVTEKWFDQQQSIEDDSETEQWQTNTGTMYYIPGDDVLSRLAKKSARQLINIDGSTQSVSESVNKQDKLVATVANYMYAKHPDIFTQHGDGYVMTVIDDVVAKWEQQNEPMQDIKAYALEIMDALGADRTNENRAQIKTDYKGHHLVNADGEEVASYPKDAQGLKKARNTLYINHKGLNTMKQEGLNEAFEAALEQLSLNESVTINTTTTSEGDDTVTVTATNEDAYELVALLKAAGLPHKAEEVMASCGEQVEEEFANEPEDDVMNGDMDHMNTQSGGLNRRKMQQKYANPLGDNPLAESDDLLRGLWDLYKEAK